LIGQKLDIRLYKDHLETYHGDNFIDKIPRIYAKNGHSINYRHVIHSLIRKPGAFENYKYHGDLFPSTIFRMTYDWLLEKNKSKASKEYLKILHLAATVSQTDVETSLRVLVNGNKTISVENIKDLIQRENQNSRQESFNISVNISMPDLTEYDSLLLEAVNG
jgi:hypothetical protein